MSDDPDCAGKGKCHGPMGWCDTCGDVDRVCHDESRRCMSHFCSTCERGPTSILDYECDCCRDQAEMEGHERLMIRAVERGDESNARAHAARIQRFVRIEAQGVGDCFSRRIT